MFGQIMTVLVIYPIKYRMISQENITIRCCLNPSFTAMLPSLWHLNIAKITNVHRHLLKSWFVPLFFMVIFNSQGGSNSKHHPAHLARRIVGWLHPIAYVLQPQAPQHGHLRKEDPPGVSRKNARWNGEFHRKNLGIHFVWRNKSRDMRELIRNMIECGKPNVLNRAFVDCGLLPSIYGHIGVVASLHTLLEYGD